MISGPNKHPHKWTEEEAYEHGFLQCVEASEEGPVNFQTAMFRLPVQLQQTVVLDDGKENRRHWMRGWNDARNNLG